MLLTLGGVIAVVLAVAYWQQHRDNSISGPRYQLPPGPPPAYYAQLATRDAHRVVNTVRHCVEQGGALPDPTPSTTGRAAFSCGHDTFDVSLAPFDRVSYLRTGPRTYRVVVSSVKGPSVTYDSATDRFSP